MIYRGLRAAALAGAVVICSTSVALAQSSVSAQGSGAGNSNSASGGSYTGMASSGGSGGGSSNSGSSGSSSSSSSSSQVQTNALTLFSSGGAGTSATTAPQTLINNLPANGFNGSNGGRGGGGGSSTSTNNIFGAYFANPMYAGSPTGQLQMGGFGTALGTWTAGNNNMNITGAVTTNRNMPNNIGVSSTAGQRYPRYSTNLKLPRNTVQSPHIVRSNIQQTISTSSALPSGNRIQVLMDGNAFVLRGTVKDDEERLLAENMARLQPGVQQVRNELVAVNSETTAGR